MCQGTKIYIILGAYALSNKCIGVRVKWSYIASSPARDSGGGGHVSQTTIRALAFVALYRRIGNYGSEHGHQFTVNKTSLAKARYVINTFNHIKSYVYTRMNVKYRKRKQNSPTCMHYSTKQRFFDF